MEASDGSWAKRDLRSQQKGLNVLFRSAETHKHIINPCGSKEALISRERRVQPKENLKPESSGELPVVVIPAILFGRGRPEFAVAL